jgi:hypothetical protein
MWLLYIGIGIIFIANFVTFMMIALSARQLEMLGTNALWPAAVDGLSLYTHFQRDFLGFPQGFLISGISYCCAAARWE